jgi:hypothetical protein
VIIAKFILEPANSDIKRNRTLDFFISDRGFQFGLLKLNNKELKELYEHAI